MFAISDARILGNLITGNFPENFHRIFIGNMIIFFNDVQYYVSIFN